jgi:ribosomal protein L32E
LLQTSRKGARVAGSVTKRELMRIVKKRTVHPFEITNASETSALMARSASGLGVD